MRVVFGVAGLDTSSATGSCNPIISDRAHEGEVLVELIDKRRENCQQPRSIAMGDPFIHRLKALADPIRVRILNSLPPENIHSQVCNVTELAEELDLPQSTVSRHLAILFRNDLVERKAMCRDVYYWINRSTMDETLAAIRNLGLKAESGEEE